MTVKRPSVLLVYAVVAVAALIWRVFAVAWDWGGLFAQIMMVAFALMAVVSVELPSLTSFQRWLCYALLTASSVLWFAAAFFAVQAVAPFIIVCLILVSIWGRNKKSRSKAFSSLVLAIPLISLLVYGSCQAVPIYQLRHLSLREVRAIDLKRLDAKDPGTKEIHLSSDTEIAGFLQALKKTTPYAPNGESNPQWQVTLVLNSGEKIYFGMEKGTLANPNTCRLRLGVTTYQNRPLCELLKPLAPEWF